VALIHRVDNIALLKKFAPFIRKPFAVELCNFVAVNRESVILHGHIILVLDPDRDELIRRVSHALNYSPDRPHTDTKIFVFFVDIDECLNGEALSPYNLFCCKLCQVSLHKRLFVPSIKNHLSLVIALVELLLGVENKLHCVCHINEVLHVLATVVNQHLIEQLGCQSENIYNKR
jgi:hypothetical protein